MWNKEKYADYQSTVEANLKHLSFVSTGGCPGCADCDLPAEPDENSMDFVNEGYFSWRPCEACNSPLGGNRYPAHGRDANNEILHFSVCEDCLYFLNYGKLDDLTMMEIEK